MKIGVLINHKINLENGGAASYLSRLIKIIDNYDFHNSLEIVFIFRYFHDLKFNKRKLDLTNILKEFYSKNKINKRFSLQSKIKKNQTENQVVENFFLLNKIDLLYYPIAESFVYNYPYIMTSWDIGHRSTYSFPELAMNNTFEDREFYRKNTLLKSFAIFVESEQSKNELINFFGVFDKKIFVLPLYPSEVINEKNSDFEFNLFLKKHNLVENDFFFYPAQFWAHKNHYGLIKAFSEFHKLNPNFKLVLSGSDKGNLEYIQIVIEKFNLKDSVLYLGFVSNKDLFILYKTCNALIYPSFLGPTNMPPLEALALGCKVACSNLSGHKESLGENAIYFDPTIPADIFDAMVKVLNSTKKQIEYSRNDEFYAKIIEKHLLEILPVRKTFGLNFNQY